MDIFQLIHENRLIELEDLITENPKIADQKNAQGVSALLFACYHRNNKAIALISSFIINLSIFEASATGNSEELKRNLLEDPGLLDSESADGFSPLGLACFFGHSEIVKYILKNNAEVNNPSNNNFRVYPIHSAVANGNPEIVLQLLIHGADPNVPQTGGIRPIHSAAHNGNSGLIKMLFDAGADLSIRDDNGKSAYDYALESKNDECAIYINKLMIE